MFKANRTFATVSYDIGSERVFCQFYMDGRINSRFMPGLSGIFFGSVVKLQIGSARQGGSENRRYF